MTPYLKKKIAKEARKLAYECAEGVAPEMAVATLHNERLAEQGLPCRCALGLVLHRAEPERDEYVLANSLAPRGIRRSLVYEANDPAADHADRQSRLVFPLLAFADAVEGA